MIDKYYLSNILKNNYMLNITSINELAGEIDENYLVQVDSGKYFVAKIANINTNYEILDMQNKAVNLLKNKLPEYLFPEALSNKAGKEITALYDSNNNQRYLRVIKYHDGIVWSKIHNHNNNILYELGKFAATVNHNLKDFYHPAAKRFIKWDPSQIEWIKKYMHLFKLPDQQELINHFYSSIEEKILPKLKNLRKSINHNDFSDNNILLSKDYYNREIIGILDFGDMTFTHTINELAIVIAYATMNKKDPLDAAFYIIKGYNDICKLNDEEIEVLFYMMIARLLISVTATEINKIEHPENPYLQISSKPAWDLLIKLRNIHPNFAQYLFRSACGLTSCPSYIKYNKWLRKNKSNIGKLLNVDLQKAEVLDLSIGSLELGHNNNFENDKSFNNHINLIMQQNNNEVIIGRYNEARPIYTTDLFYQEDNNGPNWRTLHIGLDIFAAAETTIFAPLDGIIFKIKNNEGSRNYGPTIILKHKFEDLEFYTLYGHLSTDSLYNFNEDDEINKGQPVAKIGSIEENGGWPPHLHFQIILDMFSYKGDYPGVVIYKYKQLWNEICPDPTNFLGLNQPELSIKEMLPEEIIDIRKKVLGKNLSISYDKPLKIVRGFMQYLYDHTGRKYLDTINNVPHVGHQHPSVIKIATKQMSVLNTNTRYLHENIIKYAEELCATLPNKLNVCYFVNSGSEANELALRLASTYTHQKDIIVLQDSYHGNTTGCIKISDYKFSGPGGNGPEPHIHVAPLPDTYKGPIKNDDPNAGEKYALFIKEIIDNLLSKGKKIAAFICESLPSCAGQIIFPPNYLKNAFHYIRKAGGICIIDEVQVGFGRVGSSFWGFELQNVIPDIVTLGKPIGNGHPLGAVITTQAIAEAFNNGMEYFNTFGGNPVSCAIGREVLKVINDEGLQQHAAEVGQYLLKELLNLQGDYTEIGDVRGKGLFIGIEIVSNPIDKTPDTIKANHIINHMKEKGILCSTEGKHHNVIKFKPPMPFNKQNADTYIATLNEALKSILI